MLDGRATGTKLGRMRMWADARTRALLASYERVPTARALRTPPEALKMLLIRYFAGVGLDRCAARIREQTERTLALPMVPGAKA